MKAREQMMVSDGKSGIKKTQTARNDKPEATILGYTENSEKEEGL